MSKLSLLRTEGKGYLVIFLILFVCSEFAQAKDRVYDDDSIVTEAASDQEMQEFHSRTKRQIMMHPSFGQQRGQHQSMFIPQMQQQPMYPQHHHQMMYPQQAQQQQQQQRIVQQQQQQRVIQPQPSQRFARAHNFQQPTQLPPPVNAADDSCSTSKGEPGTCVSLAKCYPYITINNQATLDLLMRVSTQCSSDSAPNVIFTQNYGSTSQSQPQLPQAQFLQKTQTICCAGGQPLKRKPTLPPPTSSTHRPPSNQQQPEQRKWDKSSLPPYLQALVPPNSTPVPIQKYPWTVAIMNGERHHCGGSLLNKYTVLTAAHCVHLLDSFAVANLRVLLGHHDISSGARPEAVTRRVIKSIYHSQFSMRTLHNDIALLILDQAAPTESVKISPVKLSTEPLISAGSVTIAGWGQMGWNLPATPMLMETTIDVWNNRKCAAVYGALAPGGITNEMICGTAVGKDACRGDSGGPLMMKKANGYEQIGVVSWGIECGRYPSVHTRISSYLPWIQKNRLD